MNEPNALVEHFFRHESGRLVALLARSLGMARLDLIEDVVQSALTRALQTWGRQGIPDDPAGWLYRTARNQAIDLLRRERVQSRLLAGVADQQGVEAPAGDDPVFGEEIGDEPLRLLFLCCHEGVPIESRLALALRTVSGFSTPEIARALLTTEANVQKRIVRAKSRLRDEPGVAEALSLERLHDRSSDVAAVIYLLFSEGYNASHSDLPIRRDLCEEALRLARMLANHPAGRKPEIFAMSALLAFHTARFDARISPSGAIVLLDGQDRTTWNWSLIREGMHWMALSASGETLSRYHIEAAISWEHCRASSFEATDWKQIITFYEALDQVAPSPVNLLNRAVAEAHLNGPASGLAFLEQAGEVPQRYPAWRAVEGELCFRNGDFTRAREAFEAALNLGLAPGDREWIQQRLERCRQSRRHD